MSNYYSFDELKEELGLTDEEIKKMVSEGELRAFRDEDKMKFKREDVNALKRHRLNTDSEDDDIILLEDDEPEGQTDASFTDELVLEEDDDDFSVGDTEALDTHDTFIEGEVGGVIEDDDSTDIKVTDNARRLMLTYLKEIPARAYLGFETGETARSELEKIIEKLGRERFSEIDYLRNREGFTYAFSYISKSDDVLFSDDEFSDDEKNTIQESSNLVVYILVGGRRPLTSMIYIADSQTGKDAFNNKRLPNYLDDDLLIDIIRAYFKQEAVRQIKDSKGRTYIVANLGSTESISDEDAKAIEDVKLWRQYVVEEGANTYVLVPAFSAEEKDIDFDSIQITEEK